jgi:pimeloyl-ACP methyl ester carboxylesterase
MKLRLSRSLPICALLVTGLALLAMSADAESGRTPSTETPAQGETRALPPGVRAEKVTFTSNGLTLAGRLLLPKPVAGKRAPGLILLTGANLQFKGAVTIAAAPTSAFAELAALMSSRGMAVLSYDTTCNGESECRRDPIPQDYTTDAIAAFRLLAKRAEVDRTKIFVLGHDEGGVFAASMTGNLPESDGRVFGVILVNTPGRVYGKILRDGAQRRLAAAGKSQKEISDYLAQFDVLAGLIGSGSVDLKAARVDENDPLFSQFARHKQYIFHNFVNDPLQIARSIQSSLLIVQGAKDANVGVRDAQYLKEAVDRQYLKDATLEVVPDLDHWMRTQKSDAQFRDEESSGPLDRSFVTIVSGWIEQRLK